MNLSTNKAPESLSTSYFIGSECDGISIITLNSVGRFSHEVTLIKGIWCYDIWLIKIDNRICKLFLQRLKNIFPIQNKFI